MAKKDKKEKAEKPEKDGKRKSSKLLIAFLIIGSLTMIVLTQMTYVLFIVGVLPTFVAYYIDRSDSRHIFHTVMPCNLAGVLPFIVQLISEGNSTSSMQMMLSDMTVLLIMYAAAGVGWVLVYASPHVATIVINALNHRQVAALKSSQSKLVNEWGDEITRVDAEI